MSPYLFTGLELAPAAFRRLIEAIPPNRLDEVRIPGRFTPREVIAHLAEWEPIMRDRVRIAVDKPGSTVKVYDEGQMAADSRYSESDPAEQLRILIRERARSIEYLRGLSPEDLQGHAYHPERGVQTVEDFANTFLGHDLYHIEQLSAYLSPKSV